MVNLKLNKRPYGLLSNGEKVELFTVSNGKMSVSASNFGCTLTSIELPSGKGSPDDILLGFSAFDSFVTDDHCFGTIVGRFANRIGNAEFSLDGKIYKLDKNDGPNMLHGGFDRWEKKTWKAEAVTTEYGMGVSFTRTSADGEQGFPGNVDATVIYTLNDDNVLTLEYIAKTDKTCPINLTNHAYFNLKGHNGGTIRDQVLKMNCDRYLEVNSALIPTGNELSVKGTPFDFTEPKTIGKDIDATGSGYDHCFCIKDFKGNKELREISVLEDPASGRKMTVKTTLPGIQVYTANFLQNVKGKYGFSYNKQEAVCLETEAFPDAPNKPSFPTSFVKPDEVYHEITQYCFEF